MNVEITSPPAEEPVSLTEARQWMKVDVVDAAEDALITFCVSAARRWCETQSGRAFITRTARASMDDFPRGDIAPDLVSRQSLEARGVPDFLSSGLEIRLPSPKLQTVSQIQYYAADGTLTVLNPSDYQVDSASEPGRILPAPDKTWPTTQAGRINAVRITFVCGYGLAAAVDERCKTAILLLAAHWYENREAVLKGTISKEIELACRALMDQIWHGQM